MLALIDQTCVRAAPNSWKVVDISVINVHCVTIQNICSIAFYWLILECCDIIITIYIPKFYIIFLQHSKKQCVKRTFLPIHWTTWYSLAHLVVVVRNFFINRCIKPTCEIVTFSKYGDVLKLWRHNSLEDLDKI